MNSLWSFHCVCQVLLDNILVFLSDNRKKGGWFGGWFFVCLSVWLLVFCEMEWVKKEGSEILKNFLSKTQQVWPSYLSYLQTVEFSCLSNLLETGSGRCLDAGKEILCFELNSSVELGCFSLGCCLLEEFVWIRVVTPVSVQVKVDLLLIKLLNRSDYSKKLLVFLTG